MRAAAAENSWVPLHSPELHLLNLTGCEYLQHADRKKHGSIAQSFVGGMENGGRFKIVSFWVTMVHQLFARVTAL